MRRNMTICMGKIVYLLLYSAKLGGQSLDFIHLPCEDLWLGG